MGRPKGSPAWNKGVPMREESKQKLRIKRKGTKAPWMIGNKYGLGEKNPNYGKFAENHPRWRSDKARPLHKSIRQLFKYRQWRSDIFTRDDFTCVLCGDRGCEIQADHYPKRYIDIFNESHIQTAEDAISCEELWNINNGRTLCVPCHRKTDTWGRRKNLTN